MKGANLIGCLVLLILLISPVTTWAGSCPDGQKWDDRRGECIKDRTSSSKKKNLSKGVVSTDVNFILREDQGIISDRMRHSVGHKKPYGYQVVTKPFPVREGKYAERFEVRPGDCGATGGWSDCKTSRERWEIVETRNKPGKSDPYSKGKAWYTFSIFFPQDYPIIEPTAVTHVQFTEQRPNGESMDNFHFRFAGSSPLLRFSIQPEFVSGVDTTKECRTPEQNQTKDICKNLKSHETFLIPEDELRGKWHDFTVFINWSTDPTKGYAKVCLNGAFSTEWFGRTRFYRDSGSTTLGYGIYRSYLYRYYEQHGVNKAPAQVVFFDRVAKHKGEPPDNVRACLEDTVPTKAFILERNVWGELIHLDIKANIEGKSILFALQYDRKEKDKEILRFDQKTLPSIDVKKIEEKGCAPRWMYKRKKEKTNNRRIRLPFYSAYMSQVVCIFNTLSEDDKEAVKLIVKNIDEIVRQISAGQPDAKRWEKAASIIKANAVFITGQKDLYSN